MARIEPEDVEEIVDADLSPSDVQAFCEDAHNIVQNRVAPHAKEADRPLLAQVETYLAAHLMTSKSPQIQSSSAGAVNVTYETEPNDYWHKAILADPTGRLARPDGFSTFSTADD